MQNDDTKLPALTKDSLVDQEKYYFFFFFFEDRQAWLSNLNSKQSLLCLWFVSEALR